MIPVHHPGTLCAEPTLELHEAWQGLKVREPDPCFPEQEPKAQSR